MSGWIGVDLDGTLATYDGWKGEQHIGDPVPEMLDRVKAWIAEGKTVKIFTARIHDRTPSTVEVIHKWCETHIGTRLEITNVKDFGMYELWDDRAITVEKNTGKIICHPHGQEITP
jgi:hypothetical protein